MAAAAHARQSATPAGPGEQHDAHASPQRPPVVPELGCPCGGGCPRCAGAQHGRRDAREAEARAAASRIDALATPRRRDAAAAAPTSSSAAGHRSHAAPAPGRRRDHAPTARGPPTAPHSAIRRTAAPPGLAGAGERLTAAERDRFEPLLACDLSAVRVHRGPGAASLARAHRAHAFAYGSHVVLGRQAGQANERVRSRLLAHELAHVGQQAATPAPAHPARGPPLQRAPVGVQRLGEEDSSILPAWIGEAAGAVYDVGAAAVDTATDVGGAAVGYVAESFAAIVERLAPGLLEILRGGAVGRFANLLCAGVDELLGRLFGSLGEIDFMSEIEQAFSGLAAGVRGLQTTLGGTASAALGTLLGPLVEGLQVWGGPMIAMFREAAGSLNAFFSTLWDHLAVPALDFLQSVGGAVWDGVAQLVGFVWDLTEPLRTAAGAAWGWVTEQFGLAWNGTADVRATLAAQASTAWQELLTTIEPVRRELTLLGGALLMLTPLGPLVVMAEVLPPLWEKLTWLWNNWNSEDVLVWARTILKDEVLPVVMGAVSRVSTLFANAASWLSETVAGVASALTAALGVFGGSRCLRAATTYLNGVAAQYRRLAAWAESGFEGLAPAVNAVLRALAAILRPILDFLVRLTMVVLNPGMLPLALTAAIWLLCPEPLKPPVIAFVYDLLIAFIEAVPAPLLLLGPAVGFVKAGILGFLRELRGGGAVADARRVAASNKIAEIAAGGGLDFVAGLALGLLHGLLDGIIDPFKLIFLLLKVLVSGAIAIGRAVAPYLTGAGGARAPPAEVEAVPDDVVADAQIVAALTPASLAEASAGAAEPGLDEAALEATARTETASRGESVAGLAELLGDAWTAILAGAESLGGMIAGALMRFIEQTPFDLGRDLGWLAGFLLLQGLIIYFSAGGYAALKGVEPVLRQILIWILRFLDLGGEILGLLGRALRPLRGPVMAGLSAFRGFLNRFSFARPLVERLDRLSAWLFRFGDETAEAAAAAQARAASETAQAAGTGGAREGGERAAVEAADDLGPGGLRAADEAGVPTVADDALKVAQLPEAIIAARAVAEAHDSVDAPVPVVLGALMLLKRRYRWIETFAAEPLAPGHYRIVFYASPPHTVDTDYTPVSLADLRSRLPGLRHLGDKQLEGIAFLNRMSPRDRDYLIDAISRLPADQHGPVLSMVGDVARHSADPDYLVARLRQIRTGRLPHDPDMSPLEVFLAEHAPQGVDEALEPFDQAWQTTTYRVSDDVVETARSALRRRMPPPGWAVPALRDGGWNAHHLIPVSLRNHPVFHVLTSRRGPGWDHNNPLVNGIALPTVETIARAQRLPLHQVIRRMGGRDITPSALPDLMFHPQYTDEVRTALNAMAGIMDNPSALNAAVLSLCQSLRRDIHAGRWPLVLF
jgi:hypothetical protein